MSNVKNILIRFTRKWRFFVGLEIFLYALAFGVFTYMLSLNFIYTITIFLIAIVVSVLVKKPWQINLQKTAQFIDNNLEEAEYSSSLFLKEVKNLSGMAKLQQKKIEKKISKQIKELYLPIKIHYAIVAVLLFTLLGYFSFVFNIKSFFSNTNHKDAITQSSSFIPVDSLADKYIQPKIITQSLRLVYPKYTNLSSRSTSVMNVRAPENSRIFWSLKFDKKIKNVSVESSENSYPLKLKNGVYKGSALLKNSGFYHFKFIDTLQKEYTSKLYAINVITDAKPKIEITGIEMHTSFNFTDTKLLNFTTKISDDYGIKDAYVVATVSKGSGESVKFREEKLTFNTPVSNAEKEIERKKQINLDLLKMEIGDELYFYVEALDLKTPIHNLSRSNTYFVIIKDTVSDHFAVEATMGVNRMPDYFRSQRQLIIDTKKLIANKKNLTAYQYKFRSNELGFDQKALRIKYAAFMGEETENIDIIDEENLDHLEENKSNDHKDHDTQNPIEGFMHDHDHENEHHLVDDKKKEDSNHPLKDYTHNHSDPEAATLFEESLKAKLLKALQQMWDAELQLRLYKPKASLPYQYKALKYLQEIKNSARIYVHRIGFDPPPIKEEKRLSGELDDINSFLKQEEIAIEDKFLYIKQASTRLEELILNKTNPNKIDQLLFKKAGNELAEIAIHQPGKHLKTLQNLKQLTLYGEKPIQLLKLTQEGLFNTIPNAKPNLSKLKYDNSGLKKFVIKELQANAK